jgi:hypothetical protein
VSALVWELDANTAWAAGLGLGAVVLAVVCALLGMTLARLRALRQRVDDLEDAVLRPQGREGERPQGG